MKTIGIVGGLSPESTIVYYKGLNAAVQARLGGHHNARILLNSLDFGEFVELKARGDWETQGKMIVAAAQSLERGGADFVLLATNTMHRFADDVLAALNIPFLHLADATAERIKASGLKRIALLGTAYTMEQDFYKKRLSLHGIEPLVPDVAGRAVIRRILGAVGAVIAAVDHAHAGRGHAFAAVRPPGHRAATSGDRSRTRCRPSLAWWSVASSR